MLQEWNEGIVFASHPNKRTVPMRDLERDFSEGKQNVQETRQVAWRQISNRNAIRDRKIIIYAALGAQQAGKDVASHMNSLQEQAEQAIKKRSGSGNTTTVMTHIKNKLEASPGFLSPIEFEQQVLKWEHTAKILAQAKSKQPKAPAPYGPPPVPSGIASQS